MIRTRTRRPSTHQWIAHITCSLAFLTCAGNSSVSAQNRLIDGDPFDEITLDEANGNAVLKTLPLELKNRVVPEKPDPLSMLRLRLVDQPKRYYDCEWQYIVKVRLFEQIVLEEAEKLTAEGDFNQAYEYYGFLLTNHPNFSGLQEAIDSYLYKHASFELKAGRSENALALLTELAQRNQHAPDLARAYEAVASRVIAERLKQHRFAAARGTIDLVREKFPNAPMAKVEKLREQMIAEATALYETARKALAAKQLRDARIASHKALAVWPDVDGVRELAQEIDRKYPVAVIGVTQPAAAATGRTIDDWPSRRIARLLARQWVELVGFSSEGGVYRSPFGGMTRDDAGTRWLIQLRPEIPTDTGATLTGYEVARELLALAERAPDERNRSWQDVFRSVAVKQVFGVQIELARPLVRPERLLEMTEAFPVPWPRRAPAPSAKASGQEPPASLSAGPAAAPLYVRPYELSDVGQETRFIANRKYFAFDSSQPQELIEQRFTDPDDALQALRRGEIDLLDRVMPWDVGTLASNETIAVDRYLLPTVHGLVPNLRQKAAANRTLRRAILYGLNRDMILARALLGGRTQEGSMVVSGPFAAGASSGDAAGYGSDRAIEPVEYEPRLAMALFALAMKELHPDAKANAPPGSRTQSLILAHAAEPVSRLACAAIIEQLKRVGIDMEAREFDSANNGPGDDYDFLYTELAAWEPVADARRLLGEQGLAGSCSPYMSLALAKLEQAVTWKEIHRRLGEVHRIAANEVVVIPLWQTVNHYAYRRGAADVGKQVVELYQNVEQWKQTQPVAAR